MGITLYAHQQEALDKLHNGAILNGTVGSGKSITGLAYYFTRVCDGDLSTLKMGKKIDIYIITTAMKRDKKEWDSECARYLLSTDPAKCYHGVKVVIDSWNNIKKYEGVSGAFFLFDEQRVVGNGAWVKAFLKITKVNQWILLSGTPGDSYMDYIPVFLANGFYRNRTEFIRNHVVYKRYLKYPAVERFVGTKKLAYLREKVLIDMNFKRATIAHHETIIVPYDVDIYKQLLRTRWNIYDSKPIETSAELCYLLRKTVNSDYRRLDALASLLRKHRRAIIFFNHTYEAELILELCNSLDIPCARWDGKKHEQIPETDSWAYVVQYAAGDSGWNCTDTDTVIFYSQSYSYKSTVQAAGRIDRLNTPFTDLYFFHLRSNSGIDRAINAALKRKQEFNATRYIKTLDEH